MRQHVTLAAIAIAVIGLGDAPAPALARGGGGHGGFGGHGSFTGRSGFSNHAGRFFTPGHAGVRGRGLALIAPGFAAPGRFVARPIRPNVIVVPPMAGSGAIVPPFTVPVVPPFGAAGSNLVPGGLPFVVTPFVGTRAFGSEPLTGAPGLPDASRAQFARPGVAAAGGDASNAAPLNAPLTACHPMPHGYHCDWPS